MVSGFLHCKKMLGIFPSSAVMAHTKHSLAGIIKLFPARERLVGDIPAGDGKLSTARECLVCAIPAGDGKLANLFYSVTWI
jgi:hypothetical protein